MSRESIAQVLRRLGIDPSSRMDAHDQDAEYTCCIAEELPEYVQLYSSGEVSTDEKRVLCCFILESLNEHIASGVEHPVQATALALLFADRELHAEEIAYWSDTTEPDSANWWPITPTLVAFASRGHVEDEP